MNLKDLLKHASPDVLQENADLLDGDKPAAVPKANPLAAQFEQLWRHLHGPELATEHRFHPERKWRFDYAHLDSKTAIELNGGVWKQGRHNRGHGYINDRRKINAAQLLGWTVIELTPEMINYDEVGQIIKHIKATTPTETHDAD